MTFCSPLFYCEQVGAPFELLNLLFYLKKEKEKDGEQLFFFFFFLILLLVARMNIA